MTSLRKTFSLLIWAVTLPIMVAHPTVAAPGDSGATIKAQVETIAVEYGINPRTFTTIAKIESNFDAAAINRQSGACGVFQFMPGTARQYGLPNCRNAEANIRAAARLLLDNQRAFVQAFGRKPTGGESYLMHQQGADGAIKLLRHPNVLATSIIGKQAVIQNGGKPTMTATQFADLWIRKF